MSTEVIKANGNSEALIPATRKEVFLSPVMSLQTANNRLQQFQEFVSGYLQESRNGGQDGGDFGAIPGAGSKKVLLKSGADKLCEIYGIYDEYEIESHENFETNLFFYRVKCILKSRNDDSIVGTGLGSCSTYETKYRWRDSQRKCPECQQPAIIKGKDFNNTGGPTGWLCFAKKGGCGKKFKDGDQAIESQVLGRVENPDILDTVNTVLKMAKKRAKIDAVIGVTRSSGIFTQDLEDVVAEAKPVERVTEDIPVSAGIVKGKAAGTEATPRKPEAPAEPEPRRKNLSKDGETLRLGITSDQAGQLHYRFRESIADPKTQKDSDLILSLYLQKEGFKDESGRGSALAIPAAEFAKVGKAAIAYAQSLSMPAHGEEA